MAYHLAQAQLQYSTLQQEGYGTPEAYSGMQHNTRIH